MRIIDADALMKHKCDVYDYNNHLLYAVPTGHIINAPTIETKEIKYYDEDDHVWKIGRVIIDDEP